VSAASSARSSSAGGANGWKSGARLDLTYPRLRRYRKRLRSLLNEAGGS